MCSSNDSTAYARAYLPGTFLRDLGHEVDFNVDWFNEKAYDIPEDLREKAIARADKNLKLAQEADVIIFQRPGNITHLMELARLKKLGKNIVVEHDDLLTEIPEKSPFSVYELDSECLTLAIEGADHVTCSTDYLKERLRVINRKISTISNGIDLALYNAHPTPHDKFRIGIIGSASFADNQAVIDLKEIAAIPNVQLVVFGIPKKEDMLAVKEDFDKVNAQKIYKACIRQYKPYEGIENIEFHDYVPITEYPDKIASLNLDLAIIPRDNSSFNKAKSNIKFLELSALKIPTVCQHFLDSDSPYDIDQDQTDKMIMLRAGWSFPSFKEQIETLINDKDLLNQIAENAHQYVQAFDIRETVKDWESVLHRFAL